MRRNGTQPAGSIQWPALDYPHGAQWRMMPNDLPPWYTVQQQTQRWLAAGVFEQRVDDLRWIVRLAEG